MMTNLLFREFVKKFRGGGTYHCKIVGTAFSGESGLKLIREKKPDIVITDICMPGMNGLAMIAATKKEIPDIQVTVLTTHRDFDFAQQAIHLGVTRFLIKPFQETELEEAIKTMVQLVKKEKQTEEKTGLDTLVGGDIIQHALEYIQEHYKEKLTLKDVAEHIFVSQWHLSKLLNGQLKKSFPELLNQERINRAKELLKNPQYLIGDISEEVGFSDTAHFSRVFKKLEGISANEYRNSL